MHVPERVIVETDPLTTSTPWSQTQRCKGELNLNQHQEQTTYLEGINKFYLMISSQCNAALSKQKVDVFLK